MERGSARRSSFKGRGKTIANRTNIETVSKATLVNALGDRLDGVWGCFVCLLSLLVVLDSSVVVGFLFVCLFVFCCCFVCFCFLCFLTLPHREPHTVFGVFIAISGEWVLLCKDFIYDH